MPKRFSFKGWYRGWFFRSLKELNFAITCELNGTKWRGAETDEFSVFYTDLYGKRRKHYPDFFIDDHIVVEVKPTRHQKGKLVQLKAAAMKEFCEKKGYIYQMISPRKIPKAKLEELIENNMITFTEDCESKIKSYLKKRRQ